MGFLDNIEGLDSTEGLVTLTKTTPIIHLESAKIPWCVLQSDYLRENRTQEFTCAISIINAALTHKRRWFILTRDKTEKLVRADSNWPGGAEFNSKKWAKYLKFMYLNKILSAPQKIGRVSIYEIIHPALSDFLPPDQVQLKEAIEFAEKHGAKLYSNYQNRNESTDDLGSDEEPKKKEVRYFVPDPERQKWIAEHFNFNGTEEDIFGDLEDEEASDNNNI